MFQFVVWLSLSITLHYSNVCYSIAASVNNSSLYTEWMTNLPPDLQRLPLKYIAIPGSHDSGTYSLRTSDINIFQDKFSKYINIANKISKNKEALGKVIHRWSQTQDINIAEQLQLGIRYFDLRVAVDKKGQQRIVHGLLGSTLKVILMQVKVFLVEHPKEVVLLDFRNVHKSLHEKEMVEDGIVNEIFTIFKNRLCPKTLANKSLEIIWKQKCQVFAFYENSTIHKHDGNMTLICPQDMIWSPFEYRIFTQYSKWIQFLDDTYRLNRPYFHVIQGIMEPHWMEIAIAGISETATLKSWVSDQASSELVKWLGSKRKVKHDVNIVIADFVENHDFVGTVLSMNYMVSSHVKISSQFNVLLPSVLFSIKYIL